MVAGALFELAWWLACRRRYREDKDALLAEFVLEKEGSASDCKLGVYPLWRIAHAIAFFRAVSCHNGSCDLYRQSVHVCPFSGSALRLCRLLICHIATSGASWISKSIPTTLDEQAIYDRIYNLAATYDWDVDHYGEDCIVAHTNPAIWHLTWGEQIFIVFDKGQVWVNSVNDLNKAYFAILVRLCQTECSKNKGRTDTECSY